MSDKVITPEVIDTFDTRFVPKHIRDLNQEELNERLKRANDKKYKPEYCQQIIDHMEKGHSFKSFAGIIGVSVRTPEKWLERYPDFREAYEQGKAANLLYWERQGMAGLQMNPRDFNTPLYIHKMKYHKHFEETTKVENTYELKVTDPSKLKAAELDEKIKQLEAKLQGKESNDK